MAAPPEEAVPLVAPAPNPPDASGPMSEDDRRREALRAAGEAYFNKVIAKAAEGNGAVPGRAAPAKPPRARARPPKQTRDEDHEEMGRLMGPLAVAAAWAAFVGCTAAAPALIRLTLVSLPAPALMLALHLTLVAALSTLAAKYEWADWEPPSLSRARAAAVGAGLSAVQSLAAFGMLRHGGVPTHLALTRGLLPLATVAAERALALPWGPGLLHPRSLAGLFKLGAAGGSGTAHGALVAALAAGALHAAVHALWPGAAPARAVLGDNDSVPHRQVGSTSDGHVIAWLVAWVAAAAASRAWELATSSPGVQGLESGNRQGLESGTVRGALVALAARAAGTAPGAPPPPPPPVLSSAFYRHALPVIPVLVASLLLGEAWGLKGTEASVPAFATLLISCGAAAGAAAGAGAVHEARGGALSPGQASAAAAAAQVASLFLSTLLVSRHSVGEWATAAAAILAAAAFEYLTASA